MGSMIQLLTEMWEAYISRQIKLMWSNYHGSWENYCVTPCRHTHTSYTELKMLGFTVWLALERNTADLVSLISCLRGSRLALVDDVLQVLVFLLQLHWDLTNGSFQEHSSFFWFHSSFGMNAQSTLEWLHRRQSWEQKWKRGTPP